MQKKDLKKYKIPNEPGVYIFRGVRKKVLYIGKATSLRNRVRSYFGKGLGKSRGQLLVKMLEDARGVDWQETDSILEVLILEVNFIKKYQPIYNTKEKSDKSFNYVVITREDFSRILTVRGKEILEAPSAKLEYKYVFGPFTQGSVLKEALKIVRKIFPYRGICRECTKTPLVHSRCKPCFNRQIGLCPGVCSGEITKKEYAKIIRNIVLLFQGKKNILLQKLNFEMKKAAKNENFELALEFRSKIFALNHINDISLIKNELKTVGYTVANSLRIEAYDVSHISGDSRVASMVVLESGEPY